MKALLERLFLETLEEITPEKVLPRQVQHDGRYLHIADQRIDLDQYEHIVVAALGKAAYTMTTSLVGLLAPRQVQGVAVGQADCITEIDGIETICGDHPYPGHRSQTAANALLKTLHGLQKSDLVIFLLSGGGSSLAECPVDNSFSQADLTELHRLLVTASANIVDINVIRKHFSAIKGGRLAAAAAPARQITLYISDVPVDDPSAVASGPSMPDKSNIEDVRLILQRLQLTDRLPVGLQRLMNNGLQETPKPGDSIFDNSSLHCLLENQDAIEALRRRVEGFGWKVEIDISVDDSPLPDAADALLHRLKKLSDAYPGQPTCVISGGELSCPVIGQGTGGRNQEFVLYMVPGIADSTISVLSVGTDGIDGNSPAAGAFANGETMKRAMAAGLSAIEFKQHSDAYTFFKTLGDTIVTGPTGNNVRDLRILVHEPRLA